MTVCLTVTMLRPDAQAATAQTLRTILAQRQRERTTAAEQQVARDRGTSSEGTPANNG